MSSIEENVITYLLTKPGITSVLGTRLFVIAPLDRTFPYCYVCSEGTQYSAVLTGSAGSATTRLRFNIVSTSFRDVSNVQEALRQELHGFTGAMGTATIARCLPLDWSEKDTPLPNPDGSNTFLSHRSEVYEFSYFISIP